VAAGSPSSGNATLEVADHDSLVLEEVRATFAELILVFTHALQRAQSEGEVRSDCPPQILAQFLVNAIEGARILEKTKASKAATEAVVTLAIGVLEPPGLDGNTTPARASGVDFRALIETPAVRPFLANQSNCRADVQFNDGAAEFLASEIDRRRDVYSLAQRAQTSRTRAPPNPVPSAP
jgi:hypothetical protein